MMPTRKHFLLAALVPALTTGCQRGATVEGDISLEGNKGAYRSVALVRNPGDSLLATIDALCQAERDDFQRRSERVQVLQAGAERFRRAKAGTTAAQVALSDSVEKYRQAASDAQRVLSYGRDTTAQRIIQLLRAATDTQVEADENGHFRFSKRQPGKYLLYSEWLAATGDKQLLAQVDASDGGKKMQNLDESTVSGRLRCR